MLLFHLSCTVDKNTQPWTGSMAGSSPGDCVTNGQYNNSWSLQSTEIRLFRAFDPTRINQASLSDFLFAHCALSLAGVCPEAITKLRIIRNAF